MELRGLNSLICFLEQEKSRRASKSLVVAGKSTKEIKSISVQWGDQSSSLWLKITISQKIWQFKKFAVPHMIFVSEAGMKSSSPEWHPPTSATRQSSFSLLSPVPHPQAQQLTRVWKSELTKSEDPVDGNPQHWVWWSYEEPTQNSLAPNPPPKRVCWARVHCNLSYFKILQKYFKN